MKTTSLAVAAGLIVAAAIWLMPRAEVAEPEVPPAATASPRAPRPAATSSGIATEAAADRTPTPAASAAAATPAPAASVAPRAALPAFTLPAGGETHPTDVTLLVVEERINPAAVSAPPIELRRFSAEAVVAHFAQQDESYREEFDAYVAASGPGGDAEGAVSLLGSAVAEWWNAGNGPAGGEPVLPSASRTADPENETDGYAFTFAGLTRGFYLPVVTDPALILDNASGFFVSGVEPRDPVWVEVADAGWLRIAVVSGTGEPLANADVRDESGDAWTRAGGGHFTHRCTAGMEHNVSVSCPGFAAAELGGLIVVPGDADEITVVLRPGGTINIHVVASGGEVEPGNRLDLASFVELIDEATGTAVTAIERWNYSNPWIAYCSGIPPGRYRAVIDLPEYAIHSETEPMELASGAELEPELPVTLPEVATITVYTSSGEPLAAPLALYPADGRAEEILVESNAEGTAGTRALRPGVAYNVWLARRQDQTSGAPLASPAATAAPCTVSAGQQATLTVTLPGILAVTAVDAQSGEPIADIQLAPIRSTDPAIVAQRIAAFAPQRAGMTWEGRGLIDLAFAPCPPDRAVEGAVCAEYPGGTSTLIVYASRYLPQAVTVTVAPGETRELTVSLDRGRTILARVKPPKNGAAPDTVVATIVQAAAGAARLRNENNWLVELTPGDDPEPVSGLPPGKYTVSIPGHRAITVDLETASEARADFTWKPGAWLAGQVKGRKGESLSSVEVTVELIDDEDSRSATFSGEADEEGRFRINGLIGGLARVSAYGETSEGEEQSGELTTRITDGENRISLTLEPNDFPGWEITEYLDVVVEVANYRKLPPETYVMLAKPGEHDGDMEMMNVAGQVLFGGIAPGSYDVFAGPEDACRIAPVSRITIRAGESLQRFRVEPPLTTFAFAAPGGATEGWVGVLSGPNAERPAIDDDGTWPASVDALSGVLCIPPARYWVEVRVAGRAPVQVAVQLPIPLAQPMVVDALPGGGLTLDVRLADGSPCDVADVELIPIGAAGPWTIRSEWGHTGSQFGFEELPPGDYEVVAIARGLFESGDCFGARIASVHVAPGERASRTMTLKKVPRLRIAVKTAAGAAAEGMIVRVRSADQTSPAGRVWLPGSDGVTNGMGKAELYPVGDGAFVVEVFAPDDRACARLLASKEVTLPASGSPPEVVVTLAP